MAWADFFNNKLNRSRSLIARNTCIELFNLRVLAIDIAALVGHLFSVVVWLIIRDV